MQDRDYNNFGKNFFTEGYRSGGKSARGLRRRKEAAMSSGRRSSRALPIRGRQYSLPHENQSSVRLARAAFFLIATYRSSRVSIGRAPSPGALFFDGREKSGKATSE